MNKPRLLIFDVNETLLDMDSLKSAINSHLDHSFAFDSWFSLLLQYAWVESLSGNYRPFDEIAVATLEMTAKKLDRIITQPEIKNLLAKIKTLPPHTDVIEGLKKLNELDIPMIALTNGTLDTAKAQMKFSGIEKFMKRIFSVEEVGLYKPHPSPYHFVLEEMNCLAKDAMMIACHPWDILGANKAGLQTCFLQRSEMAEYPLSDDVYFKVKGIQEMAQHFMK